MNTDSDSSDGWKREEIFGPKKQEVKPNLVTETEKNDPLRSVKVEIHSILVAEKEAINGREIQYKYYDMFGYELEPHLYGFNDIDELLQAAQDKIEVIDYGNGLYRYCARHDERVEDIQSLVRRQLTKEQAYTKKMSHRSSWKTPRPISVRQPVSKQELGPRNNYLESYQHSLLQRNLPINGRSMISYKNYLEKPYFIRDENYTYNLPTEAFPNSDNCPDNPFDNGLSSFIADYLPTRPLLTSSSYDVINVDRALSEQSIEDPQGTKLENMLSKGLPPPGASVSSTIPANGHTIMDTVIKPKKNILPLKSPSSPPIPVSLRPVPASLPPGRVSPLPVPVTKNVSDVSSKTEKLQIKPPPDLDKNFWPGKEFKPYDIKPIIGRIPFLDEPVPPRHHFQWRARAARFSNSHFDVNNAKSNTLINERSGPSVSSEMVKSVTKSPRVDKFQWRPQEITMIPREPDLSISHTRANFNNQINDITAPVPTSKVTKSIMQLPTLESKWNPDPVVSTVDAKINDTPPEPERRVATVPCADNNRDKYNSCRLLQMLALESLKHIKDKNLKTAYVHKFTEIAYLIRTFSSEESVEEQAISLIEDLESII